MCPLLWFAVPVLAALWLGWPGAAPLRAQPQGECGLSIRDWCTSPPGDPCGRHKNERECRADPACAGMRYRGESVAACQPDGKGFWTNCPAVGCLSGPPGNNRPARPRSLLEGSTVTPAKASRQRGPGQATSRSSLAPRLRGNDGLG